MKLIIHTDDLVNVNTHTECKIKKTYHDQT